MRVGETRAHFPAILHGRAKRPAAALASHAEGRRPERNIGLLDGKINIKFGQDFAMTAEELLAMK